GTSYEQMVQFANGDTKVIIRFGIWDENAYPSYKGSVKPVCGELIMPLNDPRAPGENGPEPGVEIMQRYYWFLIGELWHKTFFGDPPNDCGFGGECPLSEYTENYAFNIAKYYTPWIQQPGNN